MTDLARYLNGLPVVDATHALVRCCGSARWVERMIQSRPFADVEQVHAQAEKLWQKLEPGDWLQAFAAHPRIGHRAPVESTTNTWASQEQSGMDDASVDLRKRLEDLNRRYEQKFGHVFLICATNRTAPEMLAAIELRINNAPDVELQNAATEQCKITRLRLEKLVAP